MSPPDPSTEHLSPAQVAGYVDGMLPAGEHGRVEAHLADCTDCRQEVAEVHRLIISPPRERRWNLLVPITAAIAAGVAAVLLVNTAGELSEAGESPLRAPVARAEAPAAQPRIAVHSPAGAAVPRDGVVLAWSPAAAGAIYRVSVSNEGGTLIWAASSTDTVLALPGGTSLQPGARYFWTVDALLPDGRAASSGVHRFATRP